MFSISVFVHFSSPGEVGIDIFVKVRLIRGYLTTKFAILIECYRQNFEIDAPLDVQFLEITEFYGNGNS